VPVAFGTTAENLRMAIAGESHEFASMYYKLAAAAEEEGLGEVARGFRAVAEAEKHHRERFARPLKALESGTVFKRQKEAWWMCRERGYRH